MRALHLAILSAALLPALGCWSVPETVGTTPAECEANEAPVIDNLELNSWVDDQSLLWTFCLHFDWNDANADLASGYLSIEIQHFDTPSVTIDPEDVAPDSTAGELEYGWCNDTWEEGDPVRFEMRVRDSCGAVSNEKSGSYEIGGATPHVQENPDVGGNGCQQINHRCPEEEGA